MSENVQHQKNYFVECKASNLHLWDPVRLLNTAPVILANLLLTNSICTSCF